MATISKFYFHDATTGNTGTMPGVGNAFQYAVDLGSSDTGEATGAFTARAADDVIGASQTSATITSTANTSVQRWGMRRFVSAPLAAHTFATADGQWTFSAAGAESSLNHNQSLTLYVYAWRPGTGARVGTSGQSINAISLAEPTSASTEQALSATNSWNTSLTISNGDILVFEITDAFIQAMSTAYTSTFYYDGTTEASATSCATFVTPPVALTLFTGGNTYTKAGFAKENA